MRIEEIQDILAEFENRLSYLENSQPIHSPEETKETPLEQPKWTKQQWAIALSLKDEIEGFRKRFYEGLNEIKAKTKSKYNKYI